MDSDVENYFSYDKDTGLISCIKKVKHSKINVGDYLGTLDRRGYLVFGYKRKTHYIHRLAWYLFYKTLPKYQVDHINRNKSDNRIINLRDVRPRENISNTDRFNNGSSFNKTTGKYKSQIHIDGKKLYLGSFDTEDEAKGAYQKRLEG